LLIVLTFCLDFTEIYLNFRDAFGRHDNAPKNLHNQSIDMILIDLVPSPGREKFRSSSIRVPNCMVMTAIGSSQIPHRTDITAGISFPFGAKAGANSIN
jgi:hypothetical protein